MSKKLAHHIALLSGLMCGSYVMTRVHDEMGLVELFSFSVYFFVNTIFCILSFYILYAFTSKFLKRSFSSPGFFVGFLFSCAALLGCAVDALLFVDFPALSKISFFFCLVLSPIIAYYFILVTEGLLRRLTFLRSSDRRP